MNTRNGLITASGAASVLSLGYETRLNYLKRLVQHPDSENQTEQSFVRAAKDHGKLYENPAALKFLSRFPQKWCLGDIDTQYTFNADFSHDESGRKFTVGATPDLQLLGDDFCLLEIKCPYRAWLMQIDCSEPAEAMALMSDKHYIQVQTQLLVLAVKTAFIFFYIPERDGSESDNFCLWKVISDPYYQQFLLSNFFQAYQEMESGSTEHFKTIRYEAVHNRAMTADSRRDHLKFLIP